ncbi:MAG: hypothetical protein M9894_28000 [Planctomycetes bacterium]|nr:hypothetical protein [Planctomycetota bacterium]
MSSSVCPRPALTALALGLALAGAARAQDPRGVWTVETGGTLEVTPSSRTPGRHRLQWDTGNATYAGVGLLRAGRLVVGWGGAADVGVALMKREGARWTGEWTTLNAPDERGATEVWPGAALEGEREVTGTNLRGDAYRGRMTAARRGDVVHLAWKVGEREYAGVGIPLDADTLAVGFGVGNFGVMVYDLAGGDAVEGRWCAESNQRVGVERIRRRAADPCGEWAIEGGGTLTVTAAAGEGRYDLRWDTGRSTYEGVGIARGGRLVVGWGRGAAGVLIVRRQGDGWAGEWTTPDAPGGRSGTEAWPGAALEGARDVSGTNLAGGRYAGRVIVERRGDVVHLAWTVGDGQFAGVGIALDADTLAVGFGKESFGVIVYDLAGGDALEGRWCAQSDQRIGVERVRRAPR